MKPLVALMWISRPAKSVSAGLVQLKLMAFNIGVSAMPASAPICGLLATICFHGPFLPVIDTGLTRTAIERHGPPSARASSPL